MTKKNEMKINIYKFLFCAFLLVLLISPVLGETYTREYTYNTVQAAAAPANVMDDPYSQKLSVNFVNIQYLANLKEIKASSALVSFNKSAPPESYLSWDSPAIIKSGSDIISSGNIYFTHLTGSYWNIRYVPTSVNVTLLSGNVVDCEVIPSSPSNWKSYGVFDSGGIYGFRPTWAAISLPSTVTGAYFTAKGYSTRILAGDSSNYVSSSWDYKFKNTLDISKGGSGLITINLDKQITGYNGYSEVTLNDSVSSLITPASLGAVDISQTTTSPPVFLKVKDIMSGLIWQEYFFGESYYYQIAPDVGTTLTNYVGALSSDNGYLTNVKFYALYYDNLDDTVGWQGVKNASFRYSFLKNSTHWNAYAIEGSGAPIREIGTTIPNYLTINFERAGNYSVKIDVINNNNVEQIIYKNVTVTGTSAHYLNVYPLDYLSYDFIVGTLISLRSYPDNVWTNRTVNTVEDCKFALSTGFYNMYTHASGYKDAYHGAKYVFEDDVEQLILYPLDTVTNVSESAVYVGVREPESLYPIENAQVKITPGNFVQKTSASGVAVFLLQNGTQYKAIASATGYQPTTVTFTPNAASYSFDITMGSGGVVPTAVTPIQTTRTTVPVITPSAWAQGNASTCDVVANNASVIDWVKSKLACNGFTDAVSQSIALAILVILVTMGLGYSVAKVIGAGVGAILGFIGAWAVGLIPFFVFVAIIILCICITAAYLAIKASSGG